MNTKNQWVTRHTLLQRVAQKDNDDAWKDFTKYYGGFIDMLITKMRFQGDGREDMKQEILLKLWGNIGSFDPEKAAFRTWMSAIVKHTILNYYRSAQRRAKRHRVATDQKQLLETLNRASSTDLDRIIENEWRSYIIDLALKRLTKQVSKNAIEVFALTLKGISIEEICRKLGLKRDTAYTLRNRIKSRFQEEVRFLINELEF